MKIIMYIITPISILYFLLVLALAFGTSFSFFENFKLSLDGLFTGFLALTGFIFTARTFVTFKLNEVIYDNKNYRRWVEQIQKENPDSKNLYDPLKKLDNKLSTATAMCLANLILLALLACFPKLSSITPTNFTITHLCEIFLLQDFRNYISSNKFLIVIIFQKAFSSITYAFVIITVIKLLDTLRSINLNIQDIINHWEDEYKRGH